MPNRAASSPAGAGVLGFFIASRDSMIAAHHHGAALTFMGVVIVLQGILLYDTRRQLAKDGAATAPAPAARRALRTGELSVRASREFVGRPAAEPGGYTFQLFSREFVGDGVLLVMFETVYDTRALHPKQCVLVSS